MVAARRKRGRWTDEKRALAEYWARQGKRVEDIAAIVGMHATSVYAYLGPLVVYRPMMERKAPTPRVITVERQDRVPVEVEQDRARRTAARDAREQQDMMRGDATASFFGDPPPGYSALDRRRA